MASRRCCRLVSSCSAGNRHCRPTSAEGETGLAADWATSNTHAARLEHGIEPSYQLQPGIAPDGCSTDPDKTSLGWTRDNLGDFLDFLDF